MKTAVASCLAYLTLLTLEVHAQPITYIVAWGDNYSGQCNVPSPNADFVAVAGGLGHSLGLKSDGTIMAWGENEEGECNIPSPNANFIAIAAGYSHSLGLKSDGTIVAWGNNSTGQCDVPLPNTDFIAVAEGAWHSLGIKSNGSIVAWGYNFDGQCSLPSPNTNFIAVAAGQVHNLGLRSNGTIVAWGTNANGVCNVPLPNSDFVAIGAGLVHCLGLKSDGTIVAWGDNSDNQCNIPSPNADFIAISVGCQHNLGLKSNGTIVAWGLGAYNQCEVPVPNADFVAVAAGCLHSFGLRSLSQLAAPSNITALAQGPSSIAVSWQDNSSNETGFKIERRTDAGSWAVAGSVGSNTTTWIDNTVATGIRYYYRVCAWNAAGSSYCNNIASATAGPIPEAPTNLTIAAMTATSITLQWQDHACNESAFWVEEKTLPAGEWIYDGSAPTGYGCSGTVSFGPVRVAPSTTYKFRVRAYNSYGSSAWSNEVQGSTPSKPAGFEADIYVARGAKPEPACSVYVYRGNGPEFIDLTNQSGIVHVSGLSVGDTLRGIKEIATLPANKERHEGVDGLRYRLLMDTDLIDSDGNWRPAIIEGNSPSYALLLQHPIFRFNLVVWKAGNITSDFFNQLKSGFMQASAFLYNATDGQAMFGKIALYNDEEHCRHADMQIRDEDGFIPRTYSLIGQGFDESWGNVSTYLGLTPCMAFGRTFPDPFVMDGNNLPIAHSPNDPAYAKTIVHECGHYIFGAFDEYVNGRNQSYWIDNAQWQYRYEHPQEYPWNYGIMDNQLALGATEFSALNDYMLCLRMQNDPTRMTRQALNRIEPVWETVRCKLEAYDNGVNVKTPTPGHLIVGGAPPYGKPAPGKRYGPIGKVGLGDFDYLSAAASILPPEIVLMGHEVPGRETQLRLSGNDGFGAARSEIFLRRNGKLTYLGWTDAYGTKTIAGVLSGDFVIARSSDRPKGAMIGRTKLTGGTAVADLRLEDMSQIGRSPTKTYAGDSQPPGFTVSASLGTSGNLAINLRLRSDEPLGDSPVVEYSHGNSYGTMPMTPLAGDTLFEGNLVVDVADSLFEGQGVFEISAADTAGNPSQFFAPWWLNLVGMEFPTTCIHRESDWQIVPHDLTSETAALTLAPVVTPHRAGSSGLLPVGAMYSLGVRGVESFPFGIGMNLSYTDEDVEGIDETSLVIYRWDDDAVSWVREDSSRVSPAGNVVYLLTRQTGTYAIFAESATTDVTPPGGVADLGAATGTGRGSVVLMWTAPGDDGQTGQAVEYQLRYNTVPVTAASWDSSLALRLPTPSPGGTEQMVPVALPEEGDVYYFALRARDEAGNAGPISNTTYAVSDSDDPNFRPAPPEDFRAVDAPSDSGGVIRLSWNKSYDDGSGKGTVTSYRIYRNAPPYAFPEPLDTIPSGTTTYIDSTAGIGGFYTYWISAADSVQQTFGAENVAFSARNIGVPIGDFSSDFQVALNDFALLVNNYGVDSSDAEFEPLFDLDNNGQVYTSDFSLFQSNFGAGGGVPDSTWGSNSGADITYRYVRQDSAVWYLDVRARNAMHLSGYGFKVIYPSTGPFFVGAAPAISGGESNFITSEGGVAPLFLVKPGVGEVWLANVLVRPSELTAPSGDGLLARLTFAGDNMEGVTVTSVVLMDHLREIDYPDQITGITGGPGVPRPKLFQAYPNPFNAMTTIRYQIPKRAHVSIKIYNVMGQLVRTLVDEARPGGIQSVRWDGRNNRRDPVASGVYFYQMRTTGFAESKKLVLLR